MSDDLQARPGSVEFYRERARDSLKQAEQATSRGREFVQQRLSPGTRRERLIAADVQFGTRGLLTSR